MRRTVTLLAVSLFQVPSLPAQSPPSGSVGRAITQPDYEAWKSIRGTSLTPDGRWVVYTIAPGVGEGELVARSTAGNTEYRYRRGYISRPSRAPAPGFGGFGGASVSITGDSRWVVFMVDPPMDSVEKARREKWKAEKQAKSTLAIMDLTNGTVTPIARVRSFKIPRDQGAYVAYVPEPDPNVKPDTAKADSTRKLPKKDDGSPLVLRDLVSGTETRLEKVGSFFFTDNGSHVVYTVSSKDGTGDGVYSRALSGSLPGSAVTLASGAGNYKGLTLDRDGKQVAFVSDRGEFGRDKARYGLYYGKLDGSEAREVVAPDAVGAGMLVSDRGSVSFHKGGAVTFSVGPVPLDTLSADAIAEGAVFDLWHWKDPFLMTTQLVEADYFKNPRFQALYWPAENRWVKVGSDSARNIQLSEDGKTGVAVSMEPYRVQGMWGDVRFDVFLVDPASGQWKVIKTGMPGTSGWAPSPSGESSTSDISLSPGGKYVLMFERGRWWSYSVATGKTADLTGKLTGIRFDDETDDHPKLDSPVGIAGWTKNDERVLINDRWDIWEIDPNGVVAPRSVTDGVGRKSRISFRIVDLDREDPYHPTDKPVFLRASNNETKETGIWRDQIGGTGAPEKIVMMAKSFSLGEKAKNAEQYLVTQTTFREYPDIWVGPSVTSLTKISDLGSQMNGYRWGTAQLVRFKNRQGVTLKGVLHKPDGFDPKKKWPMVVAIYEERSGGLHQFATPAPMGSADINNAIYVSKGYLVFEPDIVYTDGHPGMSAVSAVVPAVQSLIDSGFVDPKRIGLAGHSWGGYQDAFIATKTNMFRAIASGAPVANMSSAYGAIRWGSGLNRSWQYELHQSRIGATPWDRPDLYIENSPLFHIKNVQTPIMIMHNDNDGAVPWYQGIELYIALRRLNKEAYLFNYNKDEHGATKYANIVDWDTRQQQFFDHYLLDAPKPDWMSKGIPVERKGRDQVGSSKSAAATGGR